MWISEDSRQVLREMGVKTAEINAYIILLKFGQMTAMEISKLSKVPYSKIYEVLNCLKEKGWINRVGTRPKRYYPLAPNVGLATARLRVEENFKSWEQAIIEELLPLYEKRGLVERPDILILHGQQGITEKLVESLKKATKEIMIATSALDKFLLPPFLLEVLEKNRVTIKLMFAGKAENLQSLRGIADLGELRVRNQMFGGGIIVDEKEAMLFLGEKKQRLVIWSNHVGLVQFARDYFRFLWDFSEKITYVRTTE